MCACLYVCSSVATIRLSFLHFFSFLRFCGLTRNQQVGSETVLQSKAPNWVYRYDTRPGKWTQILPEREEGGRTVEEPLPRYAHQVVYDPNTKMVFMHGGNAGIGGAGMERNERASGGSSGTDGDGEEGAGTSGEKEGGSGDGKEQGKERRLEDFWCMKLKRSVFLESPLLW
jgi:hypothetical protein